MRVLIADDERDMLEALRDIFSYHGFKVDAVETGSDALQRAISERYDAVVLDVMMPGKSGWEVLQEMRSAGVGTPVLFLSAKGETKDRVRGLDLGADDYLPKPFAAEELLARVRAMIRRASPEAEAAICLGNAILDRHRHTLSGPGGDVGLTNLEYRLADLFFSNPRRYFSTDALLENVWGFDSESEEGTVWVHISYLRKRFREAGVNLSIEARRNVGYALRVVSEGGGAS